jgi:hypothetical protein
MSYSRWSKNSVWYAFYNTQDDLSLWHVDATQDWTYEELMDLKSDPTQTLALIMEEYGCSLSEAKEALVYINEFIEDYEYMWLAELLEECCKEYTYRYGKVHKNDHKQDA